MAHDVRYDEDEPTWEQLEAGRPPGPKAVNRLPRHGEVLGEVREIRVAVRNQMDGIRPIEQVTLSYEWNPPEIREGGSVYPDSWTFAGMTTVVQGMDGSAKPGTPLSAEEWALLGPSLGWVWDLVHAMRPRG